MKPTKNYVPRHVGIIIDGNRRFSKRLMLKPWKGHEWGARKVEKLLEWSRDLGVKELTIYAFSEENFNRPKEEFDYLMKLFIEEFTKLKSDKRLYEENVRINFIGRIHKFPAEVTKAMQELMDVTKNNSKYIVNFAMAYSGRGEIIDATKKISQAIKEGKLDIDKINEETFKYYLYGESEPDLIIRTSGEKRLSGFLLYQGSYAELFFCEKMWPEFEKEDFLEAIKSYKNRDRRFGR